MYDSADLDRRRLERALYPAIISFPRSSLDYTT
jgi:hypothetical protein